MVNSKQKMMQYNSRREDDASVLSHHGGSVITQRQVLRACKARGWTMQPAALSRLLDAVNLSEDQENAPTTILSVYLDRLQPFMQHSTLITANLWEDMMGQVHVDKGPSKKRSQSSHPSKAQMIQVISAYETPKLTYDITRKQFQVIPSSSSNSLLGSADDKIQMLAQRYALLYQRVTRHELFRSSSVQTSSSSRAGPMKITPIESLLGKKQRSDRHNMVLLLGLLLQLEEGVYYLEDLTGQVRISFAERVATPQDAAHFLTEQAILLVEGYYHDGLFYILRFGQPLQETRATALNQIAQQVSHPHFSTRRSRTSFDDGSVMLKDENVSFVLLQDLYMDQPRVLQQFEGLLSTLETKYRRSSMSDSGRSIPVFILMGNFISSTVSSVQPTPSASVQALKSALDELLTCIGKFPFLSQQGHFVIVPGPKDSQFQNILPLPAFAKSVRPSVTHATIPNLQYSTNPCRIRYHHANNQEMVIFRYDLLHLFQQHELRLPNDATVENEPPSARMYKTVLDQGHLLPMPSIPTYWNASHSLSLYPLPNCLVVAGNYHGTLPHQGSYDNYWDCDVIQTTSFSDLSINAGGSYTIYRPTMEEDEATPHPEMNDEIPREENDEGSPDSAPVVEFFRIG